MSSGAQSFLVDARWLHKAVDFSMCGSQDVVFMVGADNGQLATMVSDRCQVVLVEPDESIAQYLYSLELRRTTVINAHPSLVLSDEPFDKLLCLQPSLLSTQFLESMVRSSFSKGIMIMPESLVAMFRARDRLGTMLRACFSVEVLNNVPMTAFSPKLDEPASLMLLEPRQDSNALNASLRLLVREAGTMRGLLTRSCREFFGYTLAEAQSAVRVLDQSLLKKCFWDVTEEEFKDVVDWLRQG